MFGPNFHWFILQWHHIISTQVHVGKLYSCVTQVWYRQLFFHTNMSILTILDFVYVIFDRYPLKWRFSIPKLLRGHRQAMPTMLSSPHILMCWKNQESSDFFSTRKWVMQKALFVHTDLWGPQLGTQIDTATSLSCLFFRQEHLWPYQVTFGWQLLIWGNVWCCLKVWTEAYGSP